MVGHQPLYADYSDSHEYIRSAADLGATFGAELPIRPAGYAVMLAALEAVWSSLALIAVVQHALGLIATVLLYLTMRRLGAPLWAALGGAAVIALVPDIVFFEHAVLAESVFLVLITAAGYTAVRGIDESDRDPALGAWLAWLAVAGALLAVAAMFRAVGQVLIPLIPIVAVIAVRGAVSRRLAAGLAAGTVPAVVLVLAYSAAISAAGGYFGLTDGQGWALYARIAPIADCAEFDPPPGTDGLCESTPPESRPGPDYYAWNLDSHARALFVGPPHNDDQVGSFAREVVEHPTHRLREVRPHRPLAVRRLRRWSRPRRERRADLVVSLRRGPALELISDDPVASLYGPGRYEISDLGRTLGDVQQVVRLHGGLILLAAVLALVGLLLGPRKIRVGIAVIGGTAFLLMVAPVMVGAFNGRYAVPAQPALVAAGLLGAWAIGCRRRQAAGPAASAKASA